MAQAGSTTTPPTPKTATTGKTPAKQPKVVTTKVTDESHKAEAKSRFNAALDEAKAGAAALKAEAGDRAIVYREQAKDRSNDMIADAKTKAGDLAVDGKGKASDALANLGRMVAEHAVKLDENFGEQYGDYARTASRSLQESAAKLDNKSVEELGEDAREMVRKSPGMAIGAAAVAGFMLSRIFRR